MDWEQVENEIEARRNEQQADPEQETEDSTGEAAVAEAQEGDTIEVADRERNGRRYEDCEGEYEVQGRVNAHTLKVKRLGEGGGHARMEAHATGDGVRVLTGDGSDPGVVWHEVGVQGQETGEAEGHICIECREWLDHFQPVNTGHATTGDSGCPHCEQAEGVRGVVHEVGDERTITGGYEAEGSRGHGSQVTLEAARAIVEN